MLTKQKKVLSVFCLVSLPSLLACPSIVERSDAQLASMFQNAVVHSRSLGPQDICHTLTAINKYNDFLLWEGIPGESRVKMVTWTSYEGYETGKTYYAQWQNKYQPSRDLWVTAVPEIQNFSLSRGLTTRTSDLRLKQLLGLPHDAEYKYFVEFWVDPHDLFRPSPDPEITDHASELDFPPDTLFMTISPDHKAWIQWQREHNTYPWTGLGYTYDWHCPINIVGLSEFVIKSGAEITVISITPTCEYLKIQE